jgi:hypothetical protein
MRWLLLCSCIIRARQYFLYSDLHVRELIHSIRFIMVWNA